MNCYNKCQYKTTSMIFDYLTVNLKKPKLSNASIKKIILSGIPRKFPTHMKNFLPVPLNFFSRLKTEQQEKCSLCVVLVEKNNNFCTFILVINLLFSFILIILHFLKAPPPPLNPTSLFNFSVLITVTVSSHL